jgi:hypothetical protein
MNGQIMGLKITSASEPIKVERLTLCIYGQPGAGKSSLAFTSERPILLDFDNGAYRASNRGDVVQVHAWANVAQITAEDLADYATVIVDTAGRALDTLTADIIRRNPKLGRGGALTLQGYGALKAEFVAWLKMIASFQKDVILIAHMDEQRSGDDVLERLDVQGGSKGEIYKAADAMGRIFVRGNERQLDFTPRENSFGKNPGQLDVLTIPRPDKDAHFLAGVIQRIKDRLNDFSEAQKEAERVIADWRALIETLETADDFNGQLADIKAAPKVCQALFAKAATAKHLAFDKAARAYAETAQEAA